jgi:glycosyltransferase involved in cell wall biosynthesis
MFNLKFIPKTIYNPINIPSERAIKKSDQPSITFLGRFEEQKRPDVALSIAKNLLKYDFYFVGMPSPKPEYIKRYNELKRLYKKYKNIHFLGFIEERQKLNLLSQSWILLNTSVREGLPISFLEAGAYENAIVSSLNQEGYPSLFGKFVEDKNFESSIRELVDSERCLAIGKTARKHMERHHAMPHIIRETIKFYKSLLE